ncbi:hypothetical protein N0V91_009296 [Didymella pomorum]|uniref:P-loop containing nucleoside triphosphate hydrolase protein n=1 Tax=Didymella pomorum TaxID=749634 RepID=A0A9W8Z7U7_9PLEO|nr:hypothetical protein N0V91_009296 [Didymella pomorum]
MLGSESENGGATPDTTPFSIPELDSLVPKSLPTILELVSPAPTHHPSGAGKTSLLYLIIAHAILPAKHPSIPSLNGRESTVILFDPLRHFSVPRLATVILHILTTLLGVPLPTLSASVKTTILTLTSLSLDHVHIFHPSSWASTIATLRSLPTYLFDSTRHKSAHRRVHSLILEDMDAFTWSLRSSYSASRPSPAPIGRETTNPLSAPSKDLTTELVQLRTLLQCHVVLTSPSILPNLFRPPFPTAWPTGAAVVRLGVRRVEVVRFAPEMGVEQALAEGGQRWEVVQRGRFEVRRVGGSLGGEGEGFVFRVGAQGVEVEREGG